MAGFHCQGFVAGMSGVRLVGALGRDQTCVSTGNPSYRKSNGRRGGARGGGRSLVQGLALALEVIGWGSRGSWNRMVFLLPKVELGWKLLMVHRRVPARRKGGG